MYTNEPNATSTPYGARGIIGVLIMAYGGPNTLDEIPGYLASVRPGRPTPSALLARITDRYRQIGGRSPLLETTTRQVGAISTRLNASGKSPHFKCYLGMRHWSPWIEETVRDMLEDGITHAVGLVLAPHYSRLSVARYFAQVAAGLKMHRGQIEFAHIKSYHAAPQYIQALANRLREGLNRWPKAARDTVHVVLSAHSLPARILAQGDPYDDQVHETARLVAERAGLPEGRWSCAYQSAGHGPEPWLGPQIQDHLIALAAHGTRDVINVPIGFVADHVETLYDLDIQAHQVAQAHGLRFERLPALNDDPLFIAALADLVYERATPWLSKNNRSSGSRGGRIRV